MLFDGKICHHIAILDFFFPQILVPGSYQCANVLFPFVEQEEELEGDHSLEILRHVISLLLCVCNCCGSEHCFYTFMQFTDGVEGRKEETLSREENLGCTQIPWLIAFSIVGSGLYSALNKGRKDTVILTAVSISWFLQWKTWILPTFAGLGLPSLPFFFFFSSPKYGHFFNMGSKASVRLKLTSGYLFSLDRFSSIPFS